jgi:uracil-DNA glycosylase family 4
VAQGAGADERALARLEREIPTCTRCPRLVAWCREVAVQKRKAFADETYWGRPVPGFGDPTAALWIVGLAPAAHGANRTGRVFTGDRSGDFLYAGLFRAGLASQAEAVARDDGLVLTGVDVSAAGRCAPPANRPTREELAACSGFLDREHAALPWRAAIALGGIAWDAMLALLARAGEELPRPRPRFAHGAELALPDTPDTNRARGRRTLLGCYHVSQQNTFTGRLTPAMLDDVLVRARALARP